jgi:uncharacterized protein
MPTLDSVRPYYPASDAVHGFEHVERVYRLAERLAWAEGADLEIVRAAALLHDAEGGHSPAESARLEHQQASAGLAAQVLQAEGWPAERITEVQHCIRAHRFRSPTEQPATLEAQVLFDADKLDAIGAIGAARAVAYAAQQGLPFFVRPSITFMESGQKEAGEVHSAYHEYMFKLKHIKERLFTETAQEMAGERHEFMQDFFNRLSSEALGEW